MLICSFHPLILEYKHYLQEVANWDKHYTVCMGIAIGRTLSVS